MILFYKYIFDRSEEIRLDPTRIRVDPTGLAIRYDICPCPLVKLHTREKTTSSLHLTRFICSIALKNMPIFFLVKWPVKWPAQKRACQVYELENCQEKHCIFAKNMLVSMGQQRQFPNHGQSKVRVLLVAIIPDYNIL